MAGRAIIGAPRRLYLCAYDVMATRAGDKRRTKLFDLLQDHGEHVQFSVFLCELSPTERKGLVAKARRILNEAEDQLLVLDIGSETIEWASRLDCVGKTWTPQVRSFII